MLRRLNTVKSKRWLNRSRSGKEFFRTGPLSQKAKQKLSDNFSEERKNVYKLRMIGKKNPAFGKPNQNNLGHTHSEETKLLMSQNRKGKKKSNETRKRMQFYAKNLRPKKVCPYCNKEISINLFNRWHDDNCKEFGSDKI